MPASILIKQSCLLRNRNNILSKFLRICEEIKLVLAWKLHYYWLAFLVVEGSIYAIEGGNVQQ